MCEIKPIKQFSPAGELVSPDAPTWPHLNVEVCSSPRGMPLAAVPHVRYCCQSTASRDAVLRRARPQRPHPCGPTVTVGADCPGWFLCESREVRPTGAPRHAQGLAVHHVVHWYKASGMIRRYSWGFQRRPVNRLSLYAVTPADARCGSASCVRAWTAASMRSGESMPATQVTICCSSTGHSPTWWMRPCS